MLLRVIPLPVHGALEFAAGFAIAALPMALGLGIPAVLAALVIGLTLMGQSIGAALSDVPASPRFSVAAHVAFDRGLALALLAATLVALIAGHFAAAGFFLAATGAQITLIALTRYTAPR